MINSTILKTAVFIICDDAVPGTRDKNSIIARRKEFRTRVSYRHIR